MPETLALPARRRKRDEFPSCKFRFPSGSDLPGSFFAGRNRVRSPPVFLRTQNVLMDEAPTAPDVIRGEASSSVERPLARVPLVLNRRNFSWITERISGVVEDQAPRWWWVCFTITSAIAMIGLFCIGYQISTGVGTWGLNHPVGWAWDITNFVFWIGIGHAGTLISAILYLLRQKWRTSINRSAEAMTLFAVICAAIFPGEIGRAHV